MHSAIARSALALVAVLLACGGMSTRVPLYGDVSRLTGEWRGQYTSDESGRAGSIAFRLEAGRDTARGDVLMFVPRAPNEAPSFQPAGQPAPLPPDARPLRIRFVQVDADRVRGRLDPYPDPACGCMVETIFEGRLQGDVITGTFTTRHLERDRVQRGRWHVHRS
ncbi:MAG TPA: hypothetical protein VK939_13550 [Longimicrobiales bacterium]|nr:hypothetical protein [Longimicrobiales bacterium]